MNHLYRSPSTGLDASTGRALHTTACLHRNKKVSYAKMPKIATWQFQPPCTFDRPKDEPKREITFRETVLPEDLAELRFKFPEFLPADDPNYRHPLAHKIERKMMLQRREQLEIPEFYVGTIMAVTVSDPNAPGRVSRFVGICISRDGNGLRATFTLRNYIEHEGVEIRYDMYNPTIRSIEVLRLEKRLDDHLLYLRDADPEFSTFPMDMDAEPHPVGQEVPVNSLKVRMKPHPWTQSWEVEHPTLLGIDKLDNVPDWHYIRSRGIHIPSEKYDLMLQYRMHIPEEDQLPIWREVKQHEDQYADQRRAEKRKKLLGKSLSK
jgi:large subunit ribosomal protein L19